MNPDTEEFFSRQLHRTSSEANEPEAAAWLVEKFMEGFVEHRHDVPEDRASAAYEHLAEAIREAPADWADRMYERMLRYDRMVAAAWLGAVSEGLREHEQHGAAQICWALRQRLLD